MEHLDALRQAGMRLADKKCWKLPMGMVAWSPTIQKARELVELKGLILKKKAGKRVSSRLLSRGMAKFHLAFSYVISQWRKVPLNSINSKPMNINALWL
jgi:hypothetical protein